MDVKKALTRAVTVAIIVLGVGQGAKAGEGFEVLKTYTDTIAPAPLSRRVLVQCASSLIGGMEIAGPKVTLYYNGINEEWCRAAHACTPLFDEIVKRSCTELKALGK